MSQTDCSSDDKTVIVWKDLTYVRRNGFFGREKTILNELDGSFGYGFHSLMGPSGAGKTSLIKILSGRVRTGLSKETKIYVSEERYKTCLIGQHESNYLIMDLTVKQNMIYASKLKNSCDKRDKHFNHLLNVKNILQELSLSHIEDNKVDECSGGQQKRLTIGLELTSIVKPNVLFIDEPTTGLDSEAALSIMKILCELSKEHRISVMVSIHQPNREMLEMFDSLYVLSVGGNNIYCGRPQDIGQHLEALQIDWKRFDSTPIESLMKIGSQDVNDHSVQSLVNSTNAKHFVIKGGDELKLCSNGIQTKSKSFKFTDFWYLLVRSMHLSYVCRWKALLVQTLFYCLTAIFISLMFNPIIGKIDKCFDHLSNPNTTCIQILEEDSRLLENIKFIFFNSVIIMFIPISVTAITFPSTANIFLKEHRNGWYSTGAYFISQSITEWLSTAVNAVLFAVITFTLSGQSMEMNRLLGYTAVLAIGMLCAQALAYLIATVFLRFDTFAVLFAVGIYSVFTNLSNVMILTKDLPHIFQLFSQFSITKLISNSVIIVIYGWSQCPNGGTSYVLNKYDLTEDLLLVYVQYSAVYIISLSIISYLILVTKSTQVLTTIYLIIFEKIPRTTKLYEQDTVSALPTVTIDDNVDNYPKLVSATTNHRDFLLELKKKLQNKNDDVAKSIEIVQLQEEVKIPPKRNVCIAWTDLTLKRQKSLMSCEKIILNRLNGCLEFGSITALLGPSGAGKTSLLKTINGRQSLRLSDESQLFLSKYHKIKTCFINQDVIEHLATGLTAGQLMIYSSRLKNREEVFDHHKNARNLMEELLISNTYDTKVEKCSGGEQKRLVIAMELTATLKANFICIDEPTSGLDSNGAEVVINCLKSLAEKHNVCVIASIHQPNSRLMAKFDTMYVLSKGGHQVYWGSPEGLAQHLTKCGIECSRIQSPIEVLIRYSCNDANDNMLSKILDKMSEKINQLSDRCSQDTELTSNNLNFLSKRFSLKDLYILLSRNVRQTYQHFWKYLILKSTAILAFGYSLTLLFTPEMTKPSGCLRLDEAIANCYQTDRLRGEALVIQNLYFNFSALLLFLILELVSTTISFAPDVKLFFNEHRNSWYSTAVYYWAKALVQVVPTIATIVGYVFIVGKFTVNHYFWDYFFVLSLGVLCIQNIGHIIGIFFASDVKSGLIVSMVYYISLCLFSNYLVPISQLHYSLQYLSDLSIIKLMIEILIIRFYGFNRCLKTEISSILYFYKLNDSQYYRNYILLVMQLIALRILVLVVLLVKNSTKLNQKNTKNRNRHRVAENTELSFYF